MSERITRNEAVARGLTVDDTVYPWVAYQGPRFKPTELLYCWTDEEATLREQLVTERQYTDVIVEQMKELSPVMVRCNGRYGSLVLRAVSPDGSYQAGYEIERFALGNDSRKSEFFIRNLLLRYWQGILRIAAERFANQRRRERLHAAGLTEWGKGDPLLGIHQEWQDSESLPRVNHFPR